MSIKQFKERLKARLRAVSLPVGHHIFWLFCLPFVVFFSVLMVVSERTANGVALRGAVAQFETVGQRTSESLQRLQEPARAWLNAMTLNPSQGLQSGYELGNLRTHATILERFPAVSALYFGYANGDFARIVSMADPRVRAVVKPPERAAFGIQVQNRQGAMPLEQWRFMTKKLELLSIVPVPLSEFDARTRPWYRGAINLKPGQSVATDPYMFAFPRQLGVTLSSAMGDGHGGVAGADFTLLGLSKYLALQEAGNTVQSLIFDEGGNLWAWSDVDKFDALSRSPGSPQVAQIADASLRMLPALAKGKLPTAGEHLSVQADGGADLIGSIFTLKGLGKSDVYVAVLQDRAEVFKEVHFLVWRLVGLGLLGLLGGAWIISRLSNRLAEPIRRLAVQTKLLERFRFTEIKMFRSRVREIRTLQDALLMTKTAMMGYARFVPKSLVQHQIALRREPKPGVESREVVALHALLVGAMHASRGSNDFAFGQFASLARMVDATRGFVDRVENDGVGAIWNAPLIQSNPALRACEAAFQALEAASRNNQYGEVTPLFMAVDLGVAGVGNFGAETGRLIYTAVGQPLDRARALAYEAKRLGVNIVVTAQVKKAVEHRFVTEQLEALVVSELSTLVGPSDWTNVQGATIELWRLVARVDAAEPMEWSSGDSVLPVSTSPSGRSRSKNSGPQSRGNDAQPSRSRAKSSQNSQDLANPNSSGI